MTHRRPSRFRLPLVIQALWWRRGLAAAVLAVATITAGAAALGPYFARAAGESTLRDQLTEASSADTGLHFQAADPLQPQVASVELGAVPGLLAKAAPPNSVHGYPSRIEGLSVRTSGAAPGVSAVVTSVVWRDGSCAHLTIVTGRCPTAAGEALVSDRTIRGAPYGWRLGGLIEGTAAGPLRIVGTYRPNDTEDPFWFGVNYFDAQPGGGDRSPDTVDDVFVVHGEFDTLDPTTLVHLDVDYPLDPAQIRLNDLPALRAQVAELGARYSPSAGLAMTTNLAKVLGAAAHERHLVDIGTLLVTLQLGLLAWLVMFQVVTDAAEARAEEIAVAKLRGLGPWALVRFGLGGPVLLLLLATPIGLLLAWVATQLFAGSVLVPGTPVITTWAPIGAAVIALLAGLVATGAAAFRTLTRPVLAQWRRTTARTHRGRIGLIIDAVVVLACVGGLIALRRAHASGSGDDTAALLVPGLLVIAVALVGTRLLPVLTRLLLPITRASRWIAVFLASRQVVRRPAGLRLAALLAVAVGLATFAVGGEAVASTNRSARAEAEVGAAQVASIQLQPGVDPVDATHRADPAGRWAMAAATWLPDGGDSVLGTVLAVDGPRLAAVGFPAAGGLSPAAIARTISAAAVPTVIVRAGRLRVSITASGLSAGRPDVQFNLRTPQQPFLNVVAGPLLDGTHEYTATVPCAAGCTLRGITWYRPYGTDGPISGTALLTGFAQGDATTFHPMDTRLARSGAWRVGPESGESKDQVQPTPAGLKAEFSSVNGGYGGIAYAYAPSPLPAVATRSAIATAPSTPSPLQVVDGLGNVATFTVRGWSQVLPAVLDDGVVLDLTFLRAELTAFDTAATWQVWLGPAAPADAISRLRAAGLTVQSVRSERVRQTQLGREGPALSLLLLLACAVVGAVVAVGGTAISISAGARRRSFEIAALGAVGVRRRQLYRAGVVEQLLLLGAAVLLGVPAGFLAARLAMPVIPEFAESTPITLHYGPPVGPVLVFAAAFAVVVVLSAVLATQRVMRAAGPGRLREADG